MCTTADDPGGSTSRRGTRLTIKPHRLGVEKAAAALTATADKERAGANKAAAVARAAEKKASEPASTVPAEAPPAG